MYRTVYDADHEAFRQAFRAFLDREAAPHADKWEHAGTPDREFISEAADAGFIGFEVPPAYGGLGIADFRYNAVMAKEVVFSGTAGDMFGMQNDIVVPYLSELTTDDQKRRMAVALHHRTRHHRPCHDRARRRIGPGIHRHHGPPRWR